MLKHPPPGRVTAHKGSDVCSTVPLIITEIARDLNLSPISEYFLSQTLASAQAMMISLLMI
jgi:hypothetical protein